jgi:hypothetical protein
MRYLVGLICVLALSVMGCSETSGTGGSGGTTGQEFPCTEQGIRDAIALGGGPHTFDCGDGMTVVTEEVIDIVNDVILNGEDNLTVDGKLVDGDGGHIVFSVAVGVTAELRGFTVTRGGFFEGPQLGTVGDPRPAIDNRGSLTLADSTVSESIGGITNESTLTLTGSVVSGRDQFGFGIQNAGTLTMSDTAVSGPVGREGVGGVGVDNDGPLTMTKCTVSGYGSAVRNRGMMAMTNTTVSGSLEGIENTGTLTVANSTVSDHDAFGIANGGTLTMTNSLVDGDCLDSIVTSNGYNIESPGDTCGFDQTGDQPGVTAEELNLGPLADNDGPTMTRLPGGGEYGDGSFAIDQIPEADCEVDTDQRGEARPVVIAGPESCDVGSVEVQP